MIILGFYTGLFWGAKSCNWSVMLCVRGRTQKPRIIFCRVGLGECSSNPPVSVYQLALVWEAVFSFSKFFWSPLQCVCPFRDGWFTNAPAHTTLSGQHFLTKNGVTPVPHLPYSPGLTLRDYFVSPDEKKFSKGNVLPMWKRWNKKWQKH